MKTSEVKIALCLHYNGSIPIFSYRWELCDTQQRISITGTFPREQFAWIKLCAVCYIYMETLLSFSPALTCLITILFLRSNYWNPSFATVNSGPNVNKSLSQVLSSTAPKATDIHEPERCWILCWAGRIVVIFGTCLTPGFHKGFY